MVGLHVRWLDVLEEVELMLELKEVDRGWKPGGLTGCEGLAPRLMWWPSPAFFLMIRYIGPKSA